MLLVSRPSDAEFPAPAKSREIENRERDEVFLTALSGQMNTGRVWRSCSRPCGKGTSRIVREQFLGEQATYRLESILNCSECGR